MCCCCRFLFLHFEIAIWSYALSPFTVMSRQFFISIWDGLLRQVLWAAYRKVPRVLQQILLPLNVMSLYITK